jgi:hypothetical protein
MSEATEFHVVDRSGWPPGPWDDEADRYEWIDEATGMPCLMKRNGVGAWCGYVAVNPDHPTHGVGYFDVEDQYDIKVHGGLTYAAFCSGEICHVPQPGEPDNVWWLGFDCAHADDMTPFPQTGPMREFTYLADVMWTTINGSKTPGDHQYRDRTYVTNQIGGLAQQLHKIGASA